MTVTDDELETRIRESLSTWAAAAPVAADRADEIQTTEPDEERLPVALIAAAVLLVIGLVAAGFARRDDDPNTFAGLSEVPARVSMGSSGVRTIASDGESLWVMSANDRRLYRIDPETREVAESIEVDGYFEGLAVGDGIAWLTGYNPTRIVAVDTTSGETVHEIPLDVDPWGVLLAFDAVWVPGGGRLTRIDPTTGDASSFDIGRSTGFVAAGDDALWLTDPDGEGIVKVDPTDGSVNGAVALGAEPRGISVAPDGDVWVTLPDSSEVVRIDPETLEATARTTVGRSPDSIAFVGEEVWVTIRGDGTLARLDASDGRVIAVHPAGSVPAAIESAFGLVWVSLNQEAAVLMIDPEQSLATVPPTTIDEIVPVEDRAIVLRCRGRSEPTIVLVTDATRESADLPTLETALASRTRVCTVARPVGERDRAEELAADVRAVLDAKVPGPYVVVGHGFGGLAGRELAATWDQVEALVLVDTNTTATIDPEAEPDPIWQSFVDYLPEVEQLALAVPRLVIVSDPDVDTQDARVGNADTRRAWFENHQRLADQLDAELVVIDGDPWVPTVRPEALADEILAMALDR